MMDIASGPKSCHDYVRALEEEKKKILMFQRELPLCLQLVNQAIDNLRQTNDKTRAEAPPVLAEFLSLKPSFSPSSDDNSSVHGNEKSPARRPDHKPDWLRSVQLWNQESDPAPKMEPPKKPIAVKVMNSCGAFQPFEKDKKHVVAPTPVNLPVVVTVDSSSSTASIGDGGGCGDADHYTIKRSKEHKDKEGQAQAQAQSRVFNNRKERRCWSQELHRRFVQVLQQLGGPHAATPKQIRELMKVDGLTNDEVKSHLQKYRLHMRRPIPAVQSNNNASGAAPQFVVVGGIWVPPTEYTVVAPQPTNTPTLQNEIYSPIALHPSTNMKSQPEHNQQNNKQPHRSPTGSLASEGRCDDNDSPREVDDATNFVSPSSSSSSHAITCSPSS